MVSMIGAAQYKPQLFHIQDQKAINTDGGTFTADDWRERDLNTVIKNDILGASLSSNRVTLPIGKYDFEAMSAGFRCGKHTALLRNITSGTDVVVGSRECGGANDIVNTNSFVFGSFEITAEEVLALWHRCSTTRNSDGMGYAVNFGVLCVYSDIKFWKVG